MNGLAFQAFSQHDATKCAAFASSRCKARDRDGVRCRSNGLSEPRRRVNLQGPGRTYGLPLLVELYELVAVTIAGYGTAKLAAQ